jgi:hypothetical protein
MFDFECASGHRHEQLVQPDMRNVMCPVCNKVATRLIAAPRVQLEGITGDFPGAAMQWEKRRESHMRKEQRNKERHGTYD